MNIRFLCAAILVLAANAFAQAPKPGVVGFRGKSYEPAQLPAEVGVAAKAAVTTWATWAKTNGYRLDLDPSRRVLLISTKSNVDAPLALVVKTIALFDSVFPPAPAAPPVVAAGPPAGASKTDATPPEDAIPEDPETPPPGAPKTLPPERGEVTKLEGKLPDFTPDSQTAVMLIAKSTADYKAALDFLTGIYPYLTEWKVTAYKYTGFTLEEPLCGSYDENASGQEEWNPDNELVHRTMTLLVLRRFSRQPYWLSTGLAWYAEMGVMKNIYCMPYRDEFVGIGEHGGWIESLGSMYSGRAKEPLKPQEFALPRGTWNDKMARTALGLADYLCKLNPRALADLMDELRRYADQNGRLTKADGTWTKIREYEVPGDQQKLMLERHFGASVLRDVITHWVSGAIDPKK